VVLVYKVFQHYALTQTNYIAKVSVVVTTTTTIREENTTNQKTNAI